MVTTLGATDKTVNKNDTTPGWWGTQRANIQMGKYLVSAIVKTAKKKKSDLHKIYIILSPPKIKKSQYYLTVWEEA